MSRTNCGGDECDESLGPGFRPKLDEPFRFRLPATLVEDMSINSSSQVLGVVPLETLELGGNSIEADGAAALREAQRGRPSDRPLDLAMLDDRPPPAQS